jgi:hypothetical protein
MSRRGRGKPQNGISLFPFLAVLICTMGALIVLLLLVVQQARVDAHTIGKNTTPSPALPQVDEAALRQQIEDADWRRELLEQQRLAKAQELSDQRLELAHLEDHIRRLQDKWKDLEAQAQQLQDQDASKGAARQRVTEEMAQLTAQISQAKLELDEAKKLASKKPKSFSIIPYEGPNGTSRRPIYIECTADAVTIQPEGFKLRGRDFKGPLGPGNPLDACLRAVREYLARNPEFAKAGEPYPLLIVRPDGVLSYAAARAAMKSWDDEFGYELIEHDTKLAYPKPDPTLVMVLERAVQDARRRQELLAAAAPSRYGGKGGWGGGGEGDGYGEGGDGEGGFGSVVDVPTYGDEPGTSTGPRGRGGGPNGNGNGGTPGYSPGSPNGGSGGSYEGGGFYGSRETGRGQASGNGLREGYASGNSLRPGGTGADGQQGGTGAGQQGDMHAIGQRGSAGPGAAGSASTGNRYAANGQGSSRQGAGQANGNRPGGGQGAGGNASSGTGAGQNGNQSGSQGGNPGDPSSQMANPNVNVTLNDKSTEKPIARKKGANWALPNYTQQATGITRPIRIRIEADRMLIVPERGDRRAARVVKIENSMSKATENLVSQIWNEVDGWGIAVSNGYWKPILNVEVAPGQDQAFADLQALLEGSGLEVRRRSP